MYIGSHHKLKDTFIVFKEKKKQNLQKFAAQQPLLMTCIYNLLVENVKQLRPVLYDTVSTC